MKSLTLYEIADQYQFLLNDLYNEETGEVNEEVLEKLNEITDTAEDKCINVVKVFKEFEKEYKAIEEERKRMAKREQAFKKQIDKLKSYLLLNMERCQIKKIECPQFVISLHKNPPKVETYDESSIPDEYKKMTIEFDKQKMRDDMLYHGVIIPGARLSQDNNIRIK